MLGDLEGQRRQQRDDECRAEPGHAAGDNADQGGAEGEPDRSWGEKLQDRSPEKGQSLEHPAILRQANEEDVLKRERDHNRHQRCENGCSENTTAGRNRREVSHSLSSMRREEED